MYTQCPACRTIFEIDEDALQASLGIVRCGHCEQRFDALATLSDSLPTGPDAALPEQDPEARTPTLTEVVPFDVLKAAAKPRRKRKPAAELRAPAPELPPEPAATPDGLPPVVTPAPPSEPPTHWFTPSLDERTRALIADAAGIPHEAIGADPDWQVIDIPAPRDSDELDIIPMATDAGTTAAIAAAPAAAAPETPCRAGVLTVVEPGTPAADAPQPTLAPVPRAPAPDTASGVPNHTGVITVVEPDTPTAAASPELPEAALTAVSDESSATVEALADAESLLADDPTPTAEIAAATTDTPVYVPPRQRRIHPHDWLWALGCLLLTVLLAAQVAWANRVNLMRDPATQPTMLNVCARIRCDMPPIRDIAQLELLSRDIRPDPNTAGALLITATVRNNARFAQPWPVVVVQLNDIDNAPVAMRRFRPAEYLPDAARRAAGLAPGTTAAVAFEVADPGPRAVAFHFSFN